jgi:hypothetical protein
MFLRGFFDATTSLIVDPTIGSPTLAASVHDLAVLIRPHVDQGTGKSFMEKLGQCRPSAVARHAVSILRHRVGDATTS